MSKYDAPWGAALDDGMLGDGTFRAGTFFANLLDALRKASGGGVSTIEVPLEILELGGARRGSILVRSDGVLSSKSTPMVHVKSLGLQAANRGMLAEWPDSVFRFLINGTGTRLTVSLGTSPASRPRPAQPEEKHSAPAPVLCPDRDAVEVTDIASQDQEELPPVQPVTLSEVVRKCINEVLSVKLESESTAGRSNRVDFSGALLSYGQIRVELEMRREDPVNNVAKAWWQAHEKTEESRRPKRDIAQFVGERMNEWAERSDRKITYKAVSFDYEPPQGGGDPELSVAEAEDLRDRVRRQLRDNR